MKWIQKLRRVLRRLKTETPAEQPTGGIDCHEAVERIFEWLDGEMDSTEAASVGEHLETCARCYPRLSFERAFRKAVERAPHRETVAAELRQGIMEALKQEGFTND